MLFNILTVFPEMFPGTLGAGVVGRALENGIWSYKVINIRDFAINDYGSVDDAQFGGGAGMVMRPDVLGDALDSVENPGKIIYFSPRGPKLTQKMVREFAITSFRVAKLPRKFLLTVAFAWLIMSSVVGLMPPQMKVSKSGGWNGRYTPARQYGVDKVSQKSCCPPVTTAI